jgi:hypothetical protein
MDNALRSKPRLFQQRIFAQQRAKLLGTVIASQKTR